MGPLPHFSMSGKFDPKSGSVPTVSVSWYAQGGLFGGPQVIGIGEGRYDEVALPLSPRVLAGIGRGIARESGGCSEGGTTINLTFNQPVKSPYEMARAARLEARRGLGRRV